MVDAAITTINVWPIVGAALVYLFTSKLVDFAWNNHLEKRARKIDGMIFGRKLKEERKREEVIHKQIIKRLEALEKVK